MYFIQHCFICRPSDSDVSEDAGIEPRTVATSALAVRRSNHSATSHPQPGWDVAECGWDVAESECGWDVADSWMRLKVNIALFSLGQPFPPSPATKATSLRLSSSFLSVLQYAQYALSVYFNWRGWGGDPLMGRQQKMLGPLSIFSSWVGKSSAKGAPATQVLSVSAC